MKLQSHHLRCTECGAIITADALNSIFRCPSCNGLYDVLYPWSSPSNGDPAASHASNLPNASALRWLWQERRTSSLPIDQSGVWRFRDLLPIVDNPENAVTLREGNTPLYDLPRCAKIAGIDWLLAKHQGMNPTGSFKDTGMTAALSVAAERNYEWVACASTGNTSAAMAAYAARAGLRSIVFIPEGKIAWGKLSQSMDYGALTIQLKTDFDGCVRILTDLVNRFPIYLLNSVNPYRLEGQKTPAFELLEQLEWQVPEHVIVPGGNLANGSALAKGFTEMHHLGLIPRIPKISIIQAEGANPLFRTIEENGGRELIPVKANTRATAIRIGNPASWRKALRALRTTGGWCEQASEQEIALAKAEIGAEGVGCEPASAVTLAGLKKLVAQGKITREERVVLVLTGHTLKDSTYTIDYHRGELFNEAENAQISPADQTLHAALRKPPIVLEPDSDIVLRELESQMKLTHA
ncbi:threonine synthase [Edaphobacter aggregans]|uniref:Threonine synthase n=1 Tax=Edaphobacter aggregans TaxID=570835 RepID=A0A428MPE6_9BACT|nr:threonine synthase [Edaphobacter aggregans]RSL18794.1 threonine synthase [Edaphobacter aggregans]